MLLQVYVLVASFVKMSGNASVFFFLYIFCIFLCAFTSFYSHTERRLSGWSVGRGRLTPSPVDNFALRLNMSLLVAACHTAPSPPQLAPLLATPPLSSSNNNKSSSSNYNVDASSFGSAPAAASAEAEARQQECMLICCCSCCCCCCRCCRCCRRPTRVVGGLANGSDSWTFIHSFSQAMPSTQYPVTSIPARSW